MSCKSRAVDALNSGQIGVEEYERMIAECDGVVLPQQSNADSTPSTTSSETPEPSASATVSASLPADSNIVESGNTFTHAGLIIISLIALIYVAKKFWNTSPMARAGIVIVGGLIAHDAMHHFFKRGFVYSVRTKLNV